jgi:pimeloyl-ACP methyl ester carboxylesterase
MRYEGLVDLGFRVVLYNPRGHGRSGGVYRLDDALADLAGYLAAEGLAGAPIFAVGHSGGGSAVLTMAARGWPILRMVLLSPILDSRASVRFKYTTGTGPELLDAFRPREGSAALLEEVLADDGWLDPQRWHGAGLRQRIDHECRDAARPGFRPGTLMENLFHPGFEVRGALAAHGPRVTCLLPTKDAWYPTAELEASTLAAGGVVVRIDSARDHFFRGGFWEIEPRLVALAAASLDAAPTGAR